MTALETEFVSVERVAEYTRIENEYAGTSTSPQASHVHRGGAGDEGECGGGSTSGGGASDGGASDGGASDGDDDARDAYAGAGYHGGVLSMGTSSDFIARALIGGEEPARGAMELRDVTLRYAAHRPPALRALRLSVRAGEKLALLGRTGCGKSSLLRAIARLYPLDSGAISVDGVDLAGVHLHEVRAAVRYVPQEPVLLEGTLLANIVAFEDEQRLMTRATDASECGGPSQRREEEAWRALHAVGLQQKVRELPRRLHTPVSVADLSAGERQLVCICRALVAGHGARGLRALLCDEPTSALDVASDARVHDALLGLGCSVLEVAHRLHAIEQFDRVAVMEAGAVVELGEPLELLKDKDSRLASLVASCEVPAASEAS